jgi:beta-galactosidase
LAVFKGNYYDGAPALVANSLGKGTAYYFGAGFSIKTAEFFLRKLGFINPYKDKIELPAEVELAVRSKENTDYIFILNYMPYTVEIDIKKPMIDLLSESILSGKTTLAKFGVLVLKHSGTGREN